MLIKNFPFVMLRDVGGLRHEVDRFFGHFNPANPATTSTPATACPAMNVWEDDSHFYAELDMPATTLDKLDVTINEGTQVTIQGERQVTIPGERQPTDPTNAVWHRQERFAGTYVRELTLPMPVDPDKVQASYENGVLKLVLPKSESAKPRKIAVRG